MQVNGTSGPSLFEAVGEPATRLQLDLSLSAEEMAAALYLSDALPSDLTDDGWVRDMIVYGLLLNGIPAVHETAAQLDRMPERAFVVFCRRRVFEVYGRAFVLAGVA